MIKTVYELDRGYLNAIAVYSVGMVASLLAMLHFRSKAKFKRSESRIISTNYKEMRKNGLSTLNLASIFIIAG